MLVARLGRWQPEAVALAEAIPRAEGPPSGDDGARATMVAEFAGKGTGRP